MRELRDHVSMQTAFKDMVFTFPCIRIKYVMFEMRCDI